MNHNDKIIITGGTGLVGTALTKALLEKGFTNVKSLSSKDCDLTNTQATFKFFNTEQPKYVFHLAASVYGIMGNMMNKGISYYNNSMININVVEASRRVCVNKIVCMGSGCVYPYPSPSLPLKENMVWMGEPHSSEDSYAYAKRGMLAQLNAYAESYNLDYAFVISANLYGPNDKFDVEYGHVTPALVRKFYEAHISKSKVTVWGDGSSCRDFMYSSDAAAALLTIMDNIQGPVNMGSNMVHSIRDLVNELSDITSMHANVTWDTTKPNGQDYRSYDLSKLNSVGFSAKVSLNEGIRKTYQWYVKNVSNARI